MVIGETDNLKEERAAIWNNGFAIINSIYTNAEVEKVISAINNLDYSGPLFRKTDDLFAIRQFIKQFPAIKRLIFNSRLQSAIKGLFGDNYFVVKSIYFDKPEKSNWFVAWHQDLTISVSQRKEIAGFGPWTVKQNQFAVQPPVDLLAGNFTVRIHLDDTDADNGALKVIPGSHLTGVYRPEPIDWNKSSETICKVDAGGIMIMRPLLMHASNRTTNGNQRRVIHIEFSNVELPVGLNWAERDTLLKF